MQELLVTTHAKRKRKVMSIKNNFADRKIKYEILTSSSEEFTSESDSDVFTIVIHT